MNVGGRTRTGRRIHGHDSSRRAGKAEATAIEVRTPQDRHASAKAGSKADSSDSEATGNAIELNGEPLDKIRRGSQKGKGTRSAGSFLQEFTDGKTAASASLPGRPTWATREGGGTAPTQRRADGADHHGVLARPRRQGHRAREHDGKDSKSSATSDGAVVDVADQIKVIVLHAESGSNGKGKTYIASINDNEIGTNDDFSQCPLSVPAGGERERQLRERDWWSGSAISDVTARNRRR